MKTKTPYFLLVKPITLKHAALDRSDSKQLSVDTYVYKNVFYLTGEVHKTGLSAPYPEQLWIIKDNDYGRYLVSSEQLKECFFRMPQVEHGDRLVLKEDTKAIDNCSSLAGSILIPKGTVLEAKCKEGTHRGHYFFDYQGQSYHLKNTFCPYPNAMPLLINESIALQ